MSKQTEILCEIVEERGRQNLIWGEQNHPIKPNDRQFTRNMGTQADYAKKTCDKAAEDGSITWYHILWEEFCEVFSEDDPRKQREELIQLNAVGLQMIEYLDRRFPKKDEL